MTQQRIPWWKTDLGEAEVEAVGRAIRERHIHHGPVCADLEARLAGILGVPHVTATTSGSVALLLSMVACGVGPGDEVVIPALTFIAPAHAALLLGARVRLVDVDAERGLIDPSALRNVLSKDTKAVVAVHLNGRACDIGALRTAIAGTDVCLIEDGAQAFYSRGSLGLLGTGGDIGTFSMGITKLVTTGEGGFVVTGDAGMQDRLKRLRNHGVLAIAENVFDGLGCNFRLTDMQAALGLVQLQRVHAKAAALRRVYRFYAEAVSSLGYIELLEVRTEDGELPLWVEALSPQRDRVRRLLADRGIESKAFHPCLGASPHIGDNGGYPNAERLARDGLVLPSGPDQRPQDLETVAQALREIAAELE